MTENQGNNIGCFKRDDFINILLILPNQHWTIDQAEQALYVLVKEGELQKIEPWRYNPIHHKNNEDDNNDKKRYLHGRAINYRYVKMSRPHTWFYYCEVCHAPNRKDSPLLTTHHGDDSVLICMNCYLREIDRGKAHVAIAQRDIVGNAQQ
jgi:hypothetical protein